MKKYIWEAPYQPKPKPPKQKTNADRIRAMSDEELAEDYCEFLNATLKKVGYKLVMEEAKSIMLKYLQRPAEGE